MTTSNRIPKCNCYEDCNGIWGKPNQDLCYGCCWSVGDKVKYTHDFRGTADVQWGRGSTKTNFCPTSASCGTYRFDADAPIIQLEYVCIAARGNYHFPENTDSTWVSDPRLPQDIPFGNRGSMTGPTAGVNGTGWGVPPVIVYPKCDFLLDPTNVCCQDVPSSPTEICKSVEYAINIAHIPGCVQNWTWTYNDSYVAFEPKNDGQGYYWHPVKEVEPTTDEPNLGKIGGNPRSCCCGNQVDKLCQCIQCYMDGCDPDRNLGLPQCERVCWPLKWNASTDEPPRLMMNDPADTGSCECTDDPIDGSRIRILPDNTTIPCDCYNDETAELWNDPCDPDPAPWPYSPTPTPDCRTCRRTGKLKHSAVIFALNLDGRDDIKYCAQQGYWIEGQVGNKWTRYPVSPFLVMTCKPIWEWDCDCIDTDGEPYLKDEVCDGDGYQICPPEERKKKEIAGGYQWLLWNGNCDAESCSRCSIGRPQPCVYGCVSVSQEFNRTGFVPQFTTSFEGKSFGPDWVPLGREPGIAPEAISAGDFSVGCGNCSESISSCAGFKSYCVRRSFERPACPGDCDGYYGLLWNPKTRCGDVDDIGKFDPCLPAPSGTIVEAGCGYGIPTEGIPEAGPLIDRYECCSSGPCSAQVYFATAGQRALCVPLFIQTLTIEPVDSDERRCQWQEWESFGKQKRCCGRSSSEDLIGKTKDVGTTPPISPPSPNDGYVFGWTEGIGWPDRARAQELCEKNTNICAPGDFKCKENDTASCDCSLQPACGGEEPFQPLYSNGIPTPRACALAPCFRAACNAGAPTCPYTPSTNPIWNVQGPTTVGYPEEETKSNYNPKWIICYQEEEDYWAFCDPEDSSVQSWLLCEIETSDGIEWGYCPKEAYETYQIDQGGGNLSLGCNCFPPVCGCIDINNPEADSPGFYDVPTDRGVCEPNNYRKFIPEVCVKDCVVCSVDIETCEYKRCPKLEEANPPGCFSPTLCPIPGQQICPEDSSNAGKCAIFYDCSSCECPEEQPFCALPDSGFLCNPPKGFAATCCVAATTSSRIIVTGQVIFEGIPVQGAEVLNNINKNVVYTDTRGYFALEIEIFSDIEILESLEIFIFGFKNFVGFIGEISVFEKIINTDEIRPIPYYLNLSKIQLQEIPITELSQSYCVVCEYECTTEMDCGSEDKTCLVELINEKDLFSNCPFEKEFNCQNTNNSCLLTLKNANVVLCDQTNNPSFC